MVDLFDLSEAPGNAESLSFVIITEAFHEKPLWGSRLISRLHLIARFRTLSRLLLLPPPFFYFFIFF